MRRHGGVVLVMQPAEYAGSHPKLRLLSSAWSPYRMEGAFISAPGLTRANKTYSMVALVAQKKYLGSGHLYGYSIVRI